MTPRRRHIATGGFTLLELLLALVITGILAGVLYLSLRIAFNAREAAMAEVGAAAVGRGALEVVRGDLAGVLPPTGILAGPVVSVDDINTRGEAVDDLAYVTNGAMLPTGDRLADLVSVELRLVEMEQPPGAAVTLHRLVRDVKTSLLAPTRRP